MENRTNFEEIGNKIAHEIGSRHRFPTPAALEAMTKGLEICQPEIEKLKAQIEYLKERVNDLALDREYLKQRVNDLEDRL